MSHRAVEDENLSAKEECVTMLAISTNVSKSKGKS